MESLNINSEILLKLLSNYINEHPELFPSDVYCQKYDYMYEELNRRLVDKKSLMTKVENELSVLQTRTKDMGDENETRIENITNLLSK